MTDTAKPIVSDLQIQAARDEATEIIIDTNLTPRQLLAQRDKAQHELEDICLTVKHLKETIDHLEKRITTTLVKCRKAGG
jgi:hypothetical protein